MSPSVAQHCSVHVKRFNSIGHADGYTWNEAYGKILGTAATACLLEIALSFCPPKILKKVFPPIVSGTAVFLIGASLIGSGVQCALANSDCNDAQLRL